MKKNFLFIPFILLFSIIFLMGCSNNKENENNNISKDATSTTTNTSTQISTNTSTSTSTSDVTTTTSTSTSTQTSINTSTTTSTGDVTTTTSTGGGTTTTSTSVEDVYYTITFVNYDGTELQSSSVKKGVEPSYNKSNPTRLNDDNYSYIFNGWSPTIVPASADAVYTATYTSQLLPYSILINLDGGTSTQTKLQFRTDNVTKDILPFDVKKNKYIFKGYELNNTKVFDENGNIVNNFQPSSNMTFKAIYEESVTLTIYYTLYNPKTNQLISTFDTKPSDMGNVSETRSYNYNTYVDLFANASEGYTFVGWYSDGQVLSNAISYKYMMWDEDFTIEARFKYTSYDLKVWSNNDDLGQVMIRNGNSQIFYNEETLEEYYKESVTIVAYSKTDTRFLGWYDEKNELVSTKAVYSFDMTNRDYTLEAKWDYFKVTYDLDGGINDSSNPTYYNSDTKNITLKDPTKEGYTFQGWEHKGNVITEINTENICHMELKALWTYYTLSTNVNNSKAGTISSYNNTKITASKSVTITATTNPGYTFNGWYDGDKQIYDKETYTFNMPASNLSYTAKWAANTNTTYKVEHYLQNLDNNNYPTTPYETDNLTGTTDTLTNGSVKTYEGFTSPTITQVIIDGDGSTVIRLQYTRNSYTISLSQNNDKAGTIRSNYTVKNDVSYPWTVTTNSITSTNKTSSSTSTYRYSFNVTGVLQFDERASTESGCDYLKIYKNGAELTEYSISGTTSKTNQQISVSSGDYIDFKYSKDSFGSSGKDTVYITNINFYYKYGESITITAKTNPGYTFNGWYDGDNQVYDKETYTFNMPASDIIYTAKWTANSNTAYKVENYLQNIDDDNYPTTPFEIDNLTGETDTLTNGSVKSYEGFTSPTITQVNINGDGSTVIKLYYTRKSYTVNLIENIIDKAGTITGFGTYKHGKSITITAKTNPGYTFIGWYNGDNELTKDSSYTFNMPIKNLWYIAKWNANSYTITLDNQAEDVKITGITSGNEYICNTQITLTATGIPNDKFLVWYSNGITSAKGTSYTFNVPAHNVNIKAILADTLESIAYSKNENKIYFGKFPQTKVTDNTLINELNTLAGTKPTSTNSYNWTDYNYYISKTVTSYMFYQDIDYDNNGTYDYRGVYFTQYRPKYYSYSSSTSSSYQDDNKYSTNTTYWFSYDPIEWNILAESDGKALILANLILDSQDYYPTSMESKFDHNDGNGYANNYELSNIRKFLNDNFYNTAFNDLQKALIKTTKVDNSVSSTGYSTNRYACEDTKDKIFLLSYSEATSSTYGLNEASARIAKGSDYAKCQGLDADSSTGYGYWWLRSPDSNSTGSFIPIEADSHSGSYTIGACVVTYYGIVKISNIEQHLCKAPCYTSCGIRPACWINL